MAGRVIPVPRAPIIAKATLFLLTGPLDGPKYRRLAADAPPREAILIMPPRTAAAEGDKKGNIVYRYNDNQVVWLKKRGFLKSMLEKEEF